MANITNYWRLVRPTSKNATLNQVNSMLDDGMDLNSAGYAAFQTISWYSNMLKGATSRLQRYRQYDAMDTGDVARALDIIAEEISNADKRSGLPFVLDYQVAGNQDVSDSLSTTLRAALRHWSTHNKLNRKVFNIARCMIKYGDCFFRKISDTRAWEYVDPTRVIGIEVSPEGERIAYHIKSSSFKGSVHTGKEQETHQIVPVAGMLHFTMSDEMGNSAPFGLSVLQAAFKDWQKLTMLEDAAIIYRIVRAPERRVFYIDVGNQPAQRVKQMLEQIKNDIRQKRIPNTADSNGTDTAYNPESMQDDYFFAVSANGRGSRVETLPSGTNWEIPELEYFMNKVFRALRIPSSYMKGQDAAGAQYNDGKVGIAYIEELRFANYIARLQTNIEEVFDEHFKSYLNTVGIKVDAEVFKLKLPEPQNFALYRQSALDTDLIASFNAVEGVKYLSKRFIMKRYLGLTEDDIQLNETMLKQERQIDGGEVPEAQQIYDPAVYDNREAVTVNAADAEPAGDEQEDNTDKKTDSKDEDKKE